MAFNRLEYFASQYGFRLINVDGDGDCFYHAMHKQMVSAGLIEESLNLDGGAELRRKLIYYLVTTNEDGGFREQYEEFFRIPFEQFINDLMDNDWADHFAISVVAHMCNISINILDNNGHWRKITPRNGEGRDVYIGYIVDQHYVALGSVHNSIIQPQNEVLDLPPNEHAIMSSAETQTLSINKKRKYHTPERVNKSNKKKKLTPAERMRAYRANMSEEAREEVRNRDRISKARSRAAETVEETAHRLEEQRIRSAATEAALSEEERRQRNEQRRIRYIAQRAAETVEEREQRCERERRQRITYSISYKTKYKIALKTEEIVNGYLYIENLLQSRDSIGSMSHECKFCGALKFKKEPAKICCLSGKVRTPTIPGPPPEIKDLYYKNTREARIFRANSRSLNNAVCLSSLAVQEKKVMDFLLQLFFKVQ